MNTNALKPTDSGRLQKTKRISVPIRLRTDDHAELKSSAEDELRSMGFIAMRRYLKGRELELTEKNQ